MYNLDLRIIRLRDEIRNLINVKTEKIKNIVIRQGRIDFPCDFSEISDGFKPYAQGEEWSDTAFDSYATFRFYLDVPTAEEGFEYALCVNTNKYDGHNMQRPQMLLLVGDDPLCGLDSNHTSVSLSSIAGKGNNQINIYAFSGISKPGPYGRYVEMDNHDGVRLYAELQLIDKRIEEYYYNLSVPFMYLDFMDKSSGEYNKILNALNDSLNFLDLRAPYSKEFYKGLDRANEFLKNNLYGHTSPECGKATLVGHTHIDVAWLWRYEHTRNKAVRSFATEAALLEKYPEHRFMSSQAALYNYVKEDNPKLYEKIKQLIKSGKWEAEGAMWVEPDMNLSSGESIIRQIMYGKRFFKEEFGVDSEILWLPDVFGYSAALPQILKKSDLKYFMTCKLPSNELNRFPYDTFIWRGIDGSEILSHCTTYVCGYNAQIESGEIYTGWQKYKQKDINDDILINFGYADGGGGVTPEQIETVKRTNVGIPGVPKTEIGTPLDYFKRLDKKVAGNRRLPTYSGEIYYERHRGTYTSMARMKRLNRKCEFLLSNAEWLSVLSSSLTGLDFPRAKFDVAMKNMLLNQFHDVLPGTAIEEVYRDADELYKETFEIGESFCSDAVSAIVTNGISDRVTVFNPYSEELSGYLKYDGKYYYVTDIPAKGYAMRSLSESICENPVTVSGDTIENQYYIITLSECSEIASLYDKKENRQVFIEGRSANKLRIFEDLPGLRGSVNEDNWNLDPYYTEREFELSAPEKTEVTVNAGEYITVRTIRRYVSSVITTDMTVYARSPRIDFCMDIDWKEKNQVIKAEFPVSVNATRATYEIQYGFVERNTTFNNTIDEARYEVCGHKWADVSDYGYGVSLLNDSKYGYSAKGSVISLTLLRSGCCPNPSADKERHTFTYSILPHKGSFIDADVVKEAYILNNPLLAAKGTVSSDLPEKYSFVECRGAVVDTVKPSEDGMGAVLRIYEPYNRRSNVTLNFGVDVKRAEFMTLTEERTLDDVKYKTEDRRISFDIDPFEIVTLKIYY